MTGVFLLIGFLLTSIHFAEAQQAGKVARIGYLCRSTASGCSPFLDALRQELSKLGWVEGKNVTIEHRFSEGKTERLPELAAELVRLKVDLIVISGRAPGLAAKKATTTIPIVMISFPDPVAAGMIASLARPGGNVTGLSSLNPELNTKRLEILRDAVPKLSRVGLLRQAGSPESTDLPLNDLRAAVPVLKLKLEEIETEAKLPAIYIQKEFVEEGGLMSYGEDYNHLYWRAAGYVDKILRGAKPADLPVQQATKFEFVITIKAAKQIGLTIPVTCSSGRTKS